MSNDIVMSSLPLKIFIDGGLVQRVEDADGHVIESEIWDSDTENLDVNDPQLKADEGGTEFYVYKV